ncbi:MAG: response regulator [Proteobacteria bacterium]|nr:response regulator [Pseudomonadota bacterium]MCP4916989.1 response regulator [Pseudomonadota bacterium]
MARQKPNGPTYYTTYQVSKILGVSLPTVVNWVNSNKMRAHRTPGGHRRIARNDLIGFAREFNYPLSDEFLAESTGRRRVLIVDDERDFSDMVREYLTIKGQFDVEVADSGFAAGYTVARFKPDIILMDIMMPDMDGFEVIRMLRAGRDTRHIPIVACTAYRDVEVERRVQEESFNGFIQKPLKLDELLVLVHETVNNLQARSA